MSYSFVLTDNATTLTAEFNPPIHLDDNSEYVIGLVNFETFNAIPNVDQDNNHFIVGNLTITIPVGCYELTDLASLIQKQVEEFGHSIEISANNNTLRTHIISSAKITFSDRTIGKLLGFKNGELPANISHEGDFPADIIKVNAINIDCSIAEGSFLNGTPVHTIHQFFPSVSPGFKIIEAPQNVIYFPVIVNIIDKITVKIVDQNGDLINFQGETITLRLHLKRLNSQW